MNEKIKILPTKEEIKTLAKKKKKKKKKKIQLKAEQDKIVKLQAFDFNKPPSKHNYINPITNYFDNSKISVKLNGDCLKQEKVRYTHKKVVNSYTVYKLNLWSFTVGQDFTLGSSLFGAVKLTKNADPDQFKYSSYDIGFDASGSFLLSDGSGFGKNIIFGADMS